MTARRKSLPSNLFTVVLVAILEVWAATGGFVCLFVCCDQSTDLGARVVPTVLAPGQARVVVLELPVFVITTGQVPFNSQCALKTGYWVKSPISL